MQNVKFSRAQRISVGCVFINKCIKQEQKKKHKKNKHGWVGTVIHWDLCKKLKFDNTTKWYMLKPESVHENQTHTIIFDFEIQMDHLIYVRILINKNNLSSCGYGCSRGPTTMKKKKARKKIGQIARFYQRAKKNEVRGDTNCRWGTWNSSKRPKKRSGRKEDQRKNLDHIDH